MSRVSRADALDALLGTTSHRGDLVRVGASGVHTNRDDLDLSDRPIDVDPCSPHRHGKLKGEKRCHGCGRTRNEVEIDEGR